MKTKLLRNAIAAVLFGSVVMGPAQAAHPDGEAVTYRPDVTFTLRTDIADGRLVFVGDKGDIKGQINPDLKVEEGAVVQINLVNGDGAIHDLALPEFGVDSDNISGKNSSTTVVFRADKNGEFKYICSLPGHVAAGMIGKIIVGDVKPEPKSTALDISKNPMEVGTPVGKRGPQTHKVNLKTTEVIGQLGDGSTYKYWTFNNTVPGPFIRVRVGDTVTVDMANDKDSSMIHSVDFHAVTGPGGGAAVTQAAPGTSKSFTFKALNPGLYVYHCATPSVAQHISNGMYGMILVEPEGGLPPVDREFYVMQGELYTAQRHGETGHHEFSREKMMDEKPEHMSFNGNMNALTKTHRMEAKVGETVRIFFGVGGPNATSSFHVIGEIFDRVYNQGDLISPPMQSVQTTTVPAGGATMVEFKTEVPGKYILVDHALARVEKGLAGLLHVVGDENHDVFEAHSAVDPNH
ncbi:copper-containing nitrite reductase [Hydrocarboniclastica marina]|uniref:copper-containing nitrite reductase n=1 Tax=Hydrocarboniclastica marina TaxID=2259620 RepID=UPI00156212EC|nr:copper-containing nitrite reductase [Hydrocarboniclastica marina]